MNRLKLYIAGPMRGRPLFNFPAFFSAAIKLRELGYDVVNPAEQDMALGLNPALPLDHPEQIPFCMKETLRLDFLHVLQCNGIVLLPGWIESSGANDEYHIARRAGLRIFYWNENRGELVEPPESHLLDSRIVFHEEAA